ncbi:MAG: Cu(I)-responsive transcriptional regulator [Bacteriovoracaceae bacterium]|nr:Cu(I)-responsive transcriptional regulator [Bacteriovoracaceae bacterium]
MKISEVAALSELNSKMIRRYEEMGIIPKAGRNLSGYRLYTEKDVHILKFVKKSRELGFSMKDTKQLVSLWRNKTRSSSHVKNIALKHQKELQKKLAEIQAMLKTLDELVLNCHGDDRPDCPILHELEKCRAK